jgi:hypothetical protein
MFVVRRLVGGVMFVVLGGCALLTGANELQTGETSNTNGTSPDGASSSSSSTSGSGSSSGATSSGSSGIPGIDGGFNLFSDGGRGAILDGGSFPDGAKPDPRAGISCGNATCAPGVHCCLSPFGATYECAASCGGSIGDLTCDDGYDCPGMVCCGEYAGSIIGASKCATSCSDPDSFILCSSDQECGAGKCEPVMSPLPTKYRACKRAGGGG